MWSEIVEVLNNNDNYIRTEINIATKKENKKRLNLWKKFAMLLFLSLTFSPVGAYAHKGVVVNDFTIKDEDNQVIEEFKSGDNIDIYTETESKYTIKLGNEKYEADKENILKTVYEERYSTIESETATLKTEPNLYAKSIKSLNQGDVVFILEKSGDWVKVSTVDTIEGWVYKDYTKAFYNANELNNAGFILENKVYERGNRILSLQKGDTVDVLDFQNNKYLISDGYGIFFTVPKDNISLNEKYKLREIVRYSKGNSLKELIEFTYNQIGKPYVWGATGYNSYDCSGLMQTAFRQIGVSIPRVSKDQGRFGEAVSVSNLAMGDMVFFNTDGTGISHVGLYIGKGRMIHAPATGYTVTIADITDSYWTSRYVGARRVL